MNRLIQFAMTMLVCICVIPLSVANESMSDKQALLIESINELKPSLTYSNEKLPKRLLKTIEIDFKNSQVLIHSTDYWFYPSKMSVQEYAYEKIYFNQHTDKVTDIVAVSVNSKDEVFLLNEETIRTIADDTYNTFSDSKSLIINYPGVSLGSITGLQYTRVVDLNKFEGIWSRSLSVTTFFEQDKLEITIHKNAEQKLYTNNGSDLLDCQEDDSKIYCVAQDIAALEFEQNLLFNDITQKFVLGFGKNWDEVKSKVFAGIERAQLKNESVTDFLAKHVDKELPLANKIDRIHEFVARDIRYVSMSEAGNAIFPHPVSETLDNRYGDCKDKTTLIIEMLEQIGVKAWPVLIATERRDPAKLSVPSTNYFNHIVACFEYKAQTHCIDATDTSSDWRYISSWIQGKVALSLVDNKPPVKLAQTTYKWNIESDATISMLPNGGQTAEINATFNNEYAAFWRSRLGLKTDSELTEWAESLYKDAISTAGEFEASVIGVENLKDEIVFNAKASFHPYVDTKEDLNVYEYENWVLYELKALDYEREHYDTHFPGILIQSTTSVTVPEFWRLHSFPANLNLDTEFGQLTREVKQRGQFGFEIVTSLSMPAKAIDANKLDKFNQVIEAFKKQSRIDFAGFVSKDS